MIIASSLHQLHRSHLRNLLFAYLIGLRIMLKQRCIFRCLCAPPSDETEHYSSKQQQAQSNDPHYMYLIELAATLALVLHLQHQTFNNHSACNCSAPSCPECHKIHRTHHTWQHMSPWAWCQVLLSLPIMNIRLHKCRCNELSPTHPHIHTRSHCCKSSWHLYCYMPGCSQLTGYSQYCSCNRHCTPVNMHSNIAKRVLQVILARIPVRHRPDRAPSTANC